MDQFIKRKQYEQLYNKVIAPFNFAKELKEDFSSLSPPGIFVGSKLSYPRVNVGILSPPEEVEDAWVYNTEKFWSEANYSIKQILSLRSALINSRFQTNVSEARTSNRFIEASQEIGVAAKPVDVEIELAKKPNRKLRFDNITSPLNSAAPLKSIKVTENVSIPRLVDKAISDTDLKASEAINYLYSKELDNQYLTQLLSIGLLGLKKDRKIVPTRWAITATDDIIAKSLVQEIKTFNTIDNYQLFYGSYLGNYYAIMLLPDIIEYELFETYLPGSSWNMGKDVKISTDYETYFGRKKYASSTVGGYYAARLPIFQHLKNIRKQASVLALRFETPEYWAQLGVWVVRQAGRKTMSDKPLVFDSKEKMLDYARNLILANFRYDINFILKSSKLLTRANTQKSLKQFI